MAESKGTESTTSGASGESLSPKGPGRTSGGVKWLTLAVVVIILVAAPLTYLVLTNKNQPTGGTVLVLEGKTSSKNMTLADLEAMDYNEALSSYQNSFGNWRGNGTYGGVLLGDLADEVGGMSPGDIMTVTASDGYEQNYSYYQVFPDANYSAIQGKTILAYKFNGSSVPDWEDGPMVAVLAPDHAFSNQDLNMTADRDPEYSKATSGGSLFAKYIEKMKISALYDEWKVNLTDEDGDTTVLTRTQYVTLDYWYGDHYVDSSQRNWSGASLTRVLGMIDDDDPGSFNDIHAATNYTVNVSAVDGYYRTMSIEHVLEDTCILANKLNGTILGEDYAPLRLVGPALSSGEQVSQIARIGISPATSAEVVLTVECGDTSLDFTMGDLKDMTAVTASGSFIKTTGAVVGPNEYTGVSLVNLISLVSSSSDYSVEAISTDSYTMVYSYSQAHDGTFAYYNETGVVQGTGNFIMIVAYEQDGAPLADMNLRIAIVDTPAPITDGHFWAKMVRTITVLPNVRDYTLNLTGITSMAMDRSTFEALASCEYHQNDYTFVNDTGTHVYTGVSLWVLVSAVDEADGPDGEYGFNDLLAQAGYNVTVGATDGYSKTFTSIKVARNDSMIVANRLDGEPLPDSEFPLRLVGAGLSSGQKVGKVSNITLSDMHETANWTLWLNGTRDVEMSAATFVGTYYCGLHARYFNYTQFGSSHAAYYNFTNGTGDHSYAGIALWELISCIDGVDLSHYEFNDTLAETGYTVRLTASNGYQVNLTSQEVARNGTLVIAFMLDGQPLPSSMYPLRLVSQWLPGSSKISQIVSIELVGV